MRSKVTFPRNVFESWRKRLVWYLFETLPVATRFNPEDMVLLVEVKFRKVYKNGTMLSVVKKVRNLRHLCCKLDKLHPFFPQLRFELLNCLLFITSFCSNTQVIGSSILRKLSWFEPKLGLVSQTTSFFVVSWIFGCFWGQFLQKK